MTDFRIERYNCITHVMKHNTIPLLGMCTDITNIQANTREGIKGYGTRYKNGTYLLRIVIGETMLY
jgi:hypothetical protein